MVTSPICIKLCIFRNPVIFLNGHGLFPYFPMVPYFPHGTIDLLWKSMVPNNCLVPIILQNIFLCVQQMKEGEYRFGTI